MFKSLFLVSLLVPSCCYSTSKDNSLPKRELPHVETLDIDSASNVVVGIYNFNQVIEYPSDEVEYTYIFDNNNICICSYLDTVYYLKEMDCSVYDGQLHWIVKYAPTQNASFLITDDLYIDSGMTLAHADFSNFRSFFFYLPQTKLLSNEEYTFFNYLFTKEDNSYVISYNGYYSFTANSLQTHFSVLGSITYDYNFYSAYTNTDSFNHTINNTGDFIFYDNLGQVYMYRNFEYPNYMIYFTNCKMSTTSYNYLANSGNFGYLPDPSYQSDFKDLLFTVMDMPVYFLSRLLNVELFGMNLFVAFAGLLTVAALLLLIRKFF